MEKNTKSLAMNSATRSVLHRKPPPVRQNRQAACSADLRAGAYEKYRCFCSPSLGGVIIYIFHTGRFRWMVARVCKAATGASQAELWLILPKCIGGRGNLPLLFPSVARNLAGGRMQAMCTARTVQVPRTPFSHQRIWMRGFTRRGRSQGCSCALWPPRSASRWRRSARGRSTSPGTRISRTVPSTWRGRSGRGRACQRLHSTERRAFTGGWVRCLAHCLLNSLLTGHRGDGLDVLDARGGLDLEGDDDVVVVGASVAEETLARCPHLVSR